MKCVKTLKFYPYYVLLILKSVARELGGYPKGLKVTRLVTPWSG